MDWRLIRVAAACALSACLADPMSPPIDPEAVQLHLEWSPSLCNQEVGNRQPAITGASAQIRASGVVGVAHGGYKLEANLQVEPDGSVVLTVTGVSLGGGISIVMCLPYTLVVSPVQSGVYDVALVHELTSPPHSTKVLSARVRVR